MKTLGILIGIIAIVGVALLSRTVLGLEKPKYTLLQKNGALEIRQYDPVTVASTQLSGSYKNSSSSGFRTIANYIFGGNQESEKIAMTSPVLMENPTAPTYNMVFVMPSASVEKGLPTPNSSNLEIQNQDWGTVAVWSFGGWVSDEKLLKEWEKMQEALQRQQITATSYDWVAQYNPPSIPPPFRHNEMWVLLPKEQAKPTSNPQ